MRICILTGAELDRRSHAMAEELRKRDIGLSGIVSVFPPRWIPRRLVALQSVVKQRGVLRTFVSLGRRRGRAYVSRIRTRTGDGRPMRERISARSYARSNGLFFWRTRVANSRRTAKILRASGASVVVAYSAGILRPIILDVPGIVFINAHAGRLPSLGGMNVVEWAALLGRPVIGTVHRIDAGIDTGEILLERPLEVQDATDLDELRGLAFSEVWGMVSEGLSALHAGEIQFESQRSDEERRLWYRMHPKLRAVAEAKVQSGDFRLVQSAALEAHKREGPAES